MQREEDEDHRCRNAGLRCRLAQLPLREGQHGCRRDRLERIRRGLWITRRDGGDRAVGGRHRRAVHAGPQRLRGRLRPHPASSGRGRGRRHRRAGKRCSTPMPAPGRAVLRGAGRQGARCVARVLVACPAWRINHPQHYGPAITDLAGVETAAAQVRERGFSASKTNLFIHDEGPSFAWRRFSSPFSPELNVDGRVIRNLRATLEGCGAAPVMTSTSSST